MIEIDTKTFYRFGIICFTIIALFGAMNYVYTFEQYNVYTKVTSAVSVFFNLIVALFFYYLYKVQFEESKESEESAVDLNEAFKDFK